MVKHRFELFDGVSPVLGNVFARNGKNIGSCYIKEIKYLTHIAYRFLSFLRYSTHPSEITPGPSFVESRSRFLKT